MPDYAIRVELRGNPSPAEYERLHTLMAQRGFGRTVTGVTKEGRRAAFDLPHATYYGSSDTECMALRDAVSAAIRGQIQQNIVMFVVQVQTWATG